MHSYGKQNHTGDPQTEHYLNKAGCTWSKWYMRARQSNRTLAHHQQQEAAENSAGVHPERPTCLMHLPPLKRPRCAPRLLAVELGGKVFVSCSDHFIGPTNRRNLHDNEFQPAANAATIEPTLIMRAHNLACILSKVGRTFNQHTQLS